MAVIQVPLEIPDEIYVRLLTGEYVRVGGVIRGQGGQLVKLLADAPHIDEAQEAVKAGFERVLKARSVVGIALGVVAVAATAGGVVYKAKRKTETAEPALPTCVVDYGGSLAAYLEAARQGRLNAEIIDRLIADLNAIKAELENGTTTIESSPKQSKTLVEVVAEHTRGLAEANEYELSTPLLAAGSQGATIIELRPYLEAQRDLFKRAA